MTKQQKIKADSAVSHLVEVPLADLYISEVNPRRSVSETHIDTLAASLARFGLIHNLAGLRDADGKVRIVAGGCRLRAIRKIVDDTDTSAFATVPVKLARDAEEAAVWANAENAAREDMTPADEIRAFGAMKAKGGQRPRYRHCLRSDSISVSLLRDFPTRCSRRWRRVRSVSGPRRPSRSRTTRR